MLDTYSDGDINDEEEFAPMSAAARRKADAEIARREREQQRGRGGRAARRSRYPGFLESEDDMEDEDFDGGILSGTKRRTRRQYDERKDIDDLEGVEDVCFHIACNIIASNRYQFLGNPPGATQ